MYRCGVYLFSFIPIALIAASQLQRPALSAQQTEAIGKKIWMNESNSSQDLLTFWSKLEPFPSLGIGHFIWYPVHYTDRFTQTFPDLIAFMTKRGIVVPAWLQEDVTKGCPWQSREEFYAAMSSTRMQELRSLLISTIDIQTNFMIERMYNELPAIIHTFPSEQQSAVTTLLSSLMATPEGTYALVDYVNFKGAGTNASEQYNGQGWGLAQVLQHMLANKKPISSESFAAAAEEVLRQRVANAPAGSADSQRLQGWLNRVKSYTGFSS